MTTIAQMRESELNQLKEIFSRIGIKVDFRKTSSNSFEIIVNDRSTSQVLDLKYGQRLDTLMSNVFGSICGWIYAELKKYAQNKECFAHECYHNAGDLGAFIRNDISEVKTKRFPIWLIRALRKYRGNSWWIGAPIPADHIFTSKDGCFISEPYNMEMCDFEELIKFCKWANFDFYVTGKSRHFPGHTFRVVIDPAGGAVKWGGLWCKS